jgi:O-antigen ligase/polysaccharide polymerase Wzy-like membrane protein
LNRSLSVGALATLLLVLPFEPRRPALPVFGLELTLLEMVAAAASAALLYLNRDRVRAVLRRSPLPLLCLWCYVAANGLSAAAAPLNRVLAAKFALRMAAAAVVAVAVAVTPRETVRRSVPALTVAGAAVAALAIAEGVGVVALDPFLDRFRSGAYWMGTVRRATAGSENPNLAAALLLYGLVPAVGAAALRRSPVLPTVTLATLFSLGLLFTYSRGGLIASTAALAALGLALRARASARAPALAVLTLLVVTAAFGATTGEFASRLAPDSYAAAYAPAEAFLALSPRQRRDFPLTLTNTGRRPWSAAVLTCSWRRAEGTLLTDRAACPVTRVPRAAPGASVRADAAIRAPAAEGRYLLVLDLAADGWVMSSLGVTPATVPTVVSLEPASARPFTPAIPEWTGRRDRAAMWRAALAMWRERPLLGIGPDNFRWAHSATAGPSHGAVYETTILANNIFLEAAADTGTLGLLALVATLVATARAAWRALLRAAPGSADAVEAAVLLALTAGVAVHGTVDTLLGFTGHYLFLGIVVGAASTADRGGAA